MSHAKSSLSSVKEKVNHVIGDKVESRADGISHRNTRRNIMLYEQSFCGNLLVLMMMYPRRFGYGHNVSRFPNPEPDSNRTFNFWFVGCWTTNVHRTPAAGWLTHCAA